MSAGNKLIKKVMRRAKNVRKNVDSDYKRYDKVDKSSSVAAGSPGVYKLLKGMARRRDSKFGQDTVMNQPKPLLALNMTATTAERFDFGGSDYGIRLTLPAAVQAFAGLRPGDMIQFLEGFLAGRYLAVVSLPDSTHVRLEDASDFVGAEGNHETTDLTAVADVAGSLNDTYFYINAGGNTTQYYVWYNVNAAGTDPAIGGKTGIEVAIATGASANAVALASRAAIGAVSASFSTSGATDHIIVTAAASGVTTDATDAGATGFGISVTLQGSADDPTASESSVVVRLEASSVKQSYK